MLLLCTSVASSICSLSVTSVMMSVSFMSQFLAVKNHTAVAPSILGYLLQK